MEVITFTKKNDNSIVKTYQSPFKLSDSNDYQGHLGEIHNKDRQVEQCVIPIFKLPTDKDQAKEYRIQRAALNKQVAQQYSKAKKLEKPVIESGKRKKYLYDRKTNKKE